MYQYLEKANYLVLAFIAIWAKKSIQLQVNETQERIETWILALNFAFMACKGTQEQKIKKSKAWQVRNQHKELITIDSYIRSKYQILVHSVQKNDF